MFPGIPLPGGIQMAVLAAVVVGAGLFFWHYTDVKDQRDAALAQVGALQTAHEVQADTIDTLRDALDEWNAQADKFQATLEALAEAQKTANAYTKRMNDVLSKHDLERLAKGKPGLIERRINDGTASIFRMFESATGGSEDGSN